MNNMENEAIEPSSPLSLSAMKRLYLEPAKFFGNVAWLQGRPENVIVAWFVGISYAMNKVDEKMMKSELKEVGSIGEGLGAWLNDSWLGYWLFVLGLGALNAVILWYLCGWWYKQRLEWSGVDKVRSTDARAAYAYQDFVQSLPLVILAIVQTLIYPSYLAAWNADEFWSTAGLVFVFWSCVVSYKAAVVGFNAHIWKARIWFLMLPSIIYAFALGLIGYMYSRA